MLYFRLPLLDICKRPNVGVVSNNYVITFDDDITVTRRKNEHRKCVGICVIPAPLCCLISAQMLDVALM